jgi:nucleotide-binding universal stress UspA family protein
MVQRMNTTSIPGFWSRVLVPTDFSEASLAGLRAASDWQRQTKGLVLLLHVTEPALEGLRIQTAELHHAAEEAAKQRLRSLVQEHFSHPENVTILVRAGNPADMICRTAADEEAGVILMPTHGRTGLGHLLLGSVAEKVVRQAPCSVLVVRG